MQEKNYFAHTCFCLHVDINQHYKGHSTAVILMQMTPGKFPAEVFPGTSPFG